jgi:hypothetical protein
MGDDTWPRLFDEHHRQMRLEGGCIELVLPLLGVDILQHTASAVGLLQVKPEKSGQVVWVGQRQQKQKAALEGQSARQIDAVTHERTLS